MWSEKKRPWIATVALGGFALPNIWRRTLAVTAISVVITVAYMRIPALHVSITTAPFVLIGLPLGIFLGFRNNTAYDRFWEGRKLWGALVNTSRSFTRQILTLIEPQEGAEVTSPEALRQAEVRMVHHLIAYVNALRHLLRDADPHPSIARILRPEDAERLRDEENVPIAILQRLAELLLEARQARWIHPFHVPVLEQSLVVLTDIQGSCERIKLTPIPYSYTVLIHRIVAGYCVLLPFGFAETIGWATPFVVLAVSYALFGLDSIGDEIEQPFGVDVNDLPLKAISRTIERNLRRRLGEELPPAVQPERGVLR